MGALLSVSCGSISAPELSYFFYQNLILLGLVILFPVSCTPVLCTLHRTTIQVPCAVKVVKKKIASNSTHYRQQCLTQI